jgi:phage terminase Nu1 subunit (DNA packaging protein)
MVVTILELAAHFGRTPRTIRNWRRAGMPTLPDGGRCDLDQVTTWLKSTRYLGASLRDLEEDERAATLIELAVVQLRRGLENLCRAFLVARGRGRDQLIDRAVRDILHGVMRQELLLEKEGGEGPRNERSSR